MINSTGKKTIQNTLTFTLIISTLLICSCLRAETSSEPESPRDNRTGTRENLIQRCRLCRLTLLDRGILEGKLLDIRSDSLEVECRTTRPDRDPFSAKVKEFHRLSVSFDEISSIRCGDPVLNGVIWGAVIAALPTFIIAEMVTSADGGDERVPADWGIVASSTAVAGGIGALLGYLIDRVDGPPFEPDKGTLRRAGRE